MCGRKTRPERPFNTYTQTLGSNSPKLSCRVDSTPTQRMFELLLNKAPQISGVLMAANRTLASCNGACRKNRTCMFREQAEDKQTVKQLVW